MNDQATKIQAVINTLQELEIKAKNETMIQLLSCLQVLAEVRDAINKPQEENNGNDNVE